MHENMSILRTRLSTRFLVTLVSVLMLLYGSSTLYMKGHSVKRHQQALKNFVSTTTASSLTSSSGKRLFESAGNSTLGFQKIFYLNLDYRHDFQDAMVMQSYLSDIEVETYHGLQGKDVSDHGGHGLPPTSNLNGMNAGDKAYTRSHANIWRQIIAERLSTALIIEGDATWDVNIRNITENFAAALNELLNTHVSPVDNSTLKLDTMSGGPTAEDPYDSQQWDILSFGFCAEFGTNDVYLKYTDFNAPEKDVFRNGSGVVLEPLNGERVVFKSGAPACSTAYAVTFRGAMKLLTRQALNFNTPAEKMIQELMRSEYLVGYGAYPPFFAQWDYVPDIGADNLDSDVTEDKVLEINADKFNQNWKKVQKTSMVWRISPAYDGLSFKDWALAALDGWLYPGKPEPYEDPYIKEANRLKEKLAGEA